MLGRIVLAVVVAIATFLGCVLVGGILVAFDIEIAVTVGDFLKKYATVIGFLAGLWYFFSGASWAPWNRG